jgi:hypothetical protein
MISKWETELPVRKDFIFSIRRRICVVVQNVSYRLCQVVRRDHGVDEIVRCGQNCVISHEMRRLMS